MSRNIQDELKTIQQALPPENSNAASASIDLGSGAPPESVVISMSVPATPNLADGTMLTLTLEDSQDDVVFTPIPELAALVIIGDVNGGPARERMMRLPDGTRRFVRMNVAAAASSGDNTAVKATLALLF